MRNIKKIIKRTFYADISMIFFICSLLYNMDNILTYFTSCFCIFLNFSLKKTVFEGLLLDEEAERLSESWEGM